MEFKNGLTIRELKKLLEDWPEEDAYGEPTEVWFTTGVNLSSPVTSVSQLNYRVDPETKQKWSDLLLGATT